MTTEVLLCGVGGQGTILAAHILAAVAQSCGRDVKVSEIHGMAQRGGAVTTVVRFGDRVSTMVACPGTSDIVVAFDALEAARALPYLKAGGTLVASDAVIKPMSVLTGRASLPHDLRGKLLRAGAVLVPADAMAAEAGNVKTSNTVMLGALSAQVDFPAEAWEKAIAAHVPPRTVEVNAAAFRAGRAFATEKEGEQA